jgi:hypothetical protein
MRRNVPPDLTPLTFLTPNRSFPSTKPSTSNSIFFCVGLSTPASSSSSIATFDNDNPCWRIKNDTANPPRGSRKVYPPNDDPRIDVRATKDVRASAR